ncbi:MAG: hypothetical protein PWP21_552 [Thermosediminibacterales bacterium]|nr:hypothetical protein [Thermosediminibacterales bacterium]
MIKNGLALYIHLPFCPKKCYYCDFNSYSRKEELMGSYIKALSTEMYLYSFKLQERKIKSIYIGGGTPTYLGIKHLETLLDSIRQVFYICEGAEITIEANPGTLSLKLLKFLYEKGVNRLSIGLQACDANILKQLGRIHTFEQFENNFNWARTAGFNNINVDLMIGLPGQTLENVSKCVCKVINLKPEHISVYSLKIEESTRFYEMYKAGQLILPGEDEERLFYHTTVNFLIQNGYKHYEISNFALPGYACCHNLIYWENKEYLGLGAGAHSYIDGKRFYNTETPEKYIELLNKKNLPVEEYESINLPTEMAETMFMGLRLVQGVSRKKFFDRFGKTLDEVYGAEIKKLVSLGLLIDDGKRIRLSTRGLDLANEVFMEFLP